MYMQIFVDHDHNHVICVGLGQRMLTGLGSLDQCVSKCIGHAS